MDKNIFSILIATLIFFTACNNSVKQDAEKITSDNKKDSVLPAKDHDSLFHAHAKPGTKKLSCCVSPPSRSKIKVVKK